MTPRMVRPLTAMLALAFLAAESSGVAAQEGPAGRGAFQIGWHAPDIDGLNSSLSDAGFPTFDDAGFLTLGGFGFGTVGRVIIGGEGHGFLPREEDTADGVYRSRLTGGYGLFNLGYVAWSSPRVDVYPILGVGGGGMSLEIIERSSPTFDDVLDDPGTSTTLTSETWLVSAALGVDWRFGGHDARRDRTRDRIRDRDRDEDDDRGRGGFFVGLRGGWMWAPGDVNWELDELNDVAGGPDTVPDGFFVRVSIGGWGG